MYWAVNASEKFFEVGAPVNYRLEAYIDWPLGPTVVDLNFVIDGDQLTLP